jgi:hypothetical protein
MVRRSQVVWRFDFSSHYIYSLGRGYFGYYPGGALAVIQPKWISDSARVDIQEMKGYQVVIFIKSL